MILVKYNWICLLTNYETQEKELYSKKCPKVEKILPKQKGRSCHIITISNSIILCKCSPPLMNELRLNNQTVHIYIQYLRNIYMCTYNLILVMKMLSIQN